MGNGEPFGCDVHRCNGCLRCLPMYSWYDTIIAAYEEGTLGFVSWFLSIMSIASLCSTPMKFPTLPSHPPSPTFVPCHFLPAKL